jgi:hypothetical protein
MKSLLVGMALVLLSLTPVFASGTLQVKLTWMNTDQSSQIQVEKGPASTGPFVFLAKLDPGTTSYVDATNAAGDKACYRMAYWNGAALGSYTTPKCKTFSLIPPTKPGTVATQ